MKYICNWVVAVFLFSISQIFLCQKQQYFDLDWLHTYGSSGTDSISKVLTDQSGYIYVIGTFEDTIRFGVGDALRRVSNGHKDVFILKLNNTKDSTGRRNVLWVKTFGGSEEDRVNDIDINGNKIYVVGEFKNTVDFDPSSNTFNATSMVSYDFNSYVLQLNSNGDFSWVKVVGQKQTRPPDDAGKIVSVVAHRWGCYVVGVYGDSLFCYQNSTYFQSVYAGSHYHDIFILNLGSDGYVGELKSIGNEGSKESIYDMEMINDKIYILGSFAPNDPSILPYTLSDTSDHIQFNPSYTPDPRTSYGPDLSLNPQYDRDLFIIGLNEYLEFEWVKGFGRIFPSSNWEDIMFDIEGNSLGDVFIAGSFRGNADFDTDPNGYFNMNSTNLSTYDIFVLKLNSQGRYLWSKGFGGSANEYFFDMYIEDDKIYTLGTFEANCNFDFGNGDDIRNPVGTGSNIFLHCMSTGGQYQWTNTFGNVGGDIEKTVLYAQDSSFYLFGSFKNAIDFDPNNGIHTVVALGKTDMFFQKIVIGKKKCTDSSYKTVINSCDTLVTYIDTNCNISYDTLACKCTDSSFRTVINSCDTLVTYIDTNCNISYDTLACKCMDSSFRTVINSCDTLVTYIDTNCNISYDTLTCKCTDSSFRTIINSCDTLITYINTDCFYSYDTLLCKTMSIYDIEKNIFNVYPNPTKRGVHIQFVSNHKQVKIEVINVLGKVISSQNFSVVNETYINLPQKLGMYFISIEIEGKKSVIPILKYIEK